jgi:hypothetical protein
MNVNDPDDIHLALKGVSLVVNCVDLAEPYHLLR